MQRRTTILLIGLCLTAAACGDKKPLSAIEYFRNATTNYRSGALAVAVDQYRELLDQHPFSEYNEEAELKIAHAQYLNGNYAEAVVALTDFQRRHPTSANLPFIGYTLGMCYVQQMTTPDRDQTAALNAQTYFLTVTRQFPESPFAELAREELARCREMLAEHELYVAKFYDNKGNYKATEIRLLSLASLYGETNVAADGLLQLAGMYQRQQQLDNAALAYRAITQLHPGSIYAIEAQQALQNLDRSEGSLTGDPVDMLLAANGRQRSPTAFDTMQLPGIDLPKVPRRPGGMPGPALTPPFDPFGRGRSYY